MTLHRLISGMLLVAAALFVTAAQAQDELSTTTEIRPVTITPIQRSGDGRIVSEVTRSAAVPGPQTVMQETEVTVLGFQIPDFDPEELTTRFWHFGMFSESGNGSGTAYPDMNGYVEYEVHRMPGQSAWQTFLYSVHAETDDVQVFIDVDDLTVNKAVEVLTNLALNSDIQRRIRAGERPLAGRSGSRFRGPPPAIGDQRRLGLLGDYLSLEDLQEQIYQQTRCNVERDDGGYYYLESCN